MVQIDRPTPQVAVGASEVDSQAITEDAIQAPEDAGENPGEAPSGFAGSEDELSTADSGPARPDWQSQRTRRSRQIALVVAFSISGLLVASLLFIWFVKQWGQGDGVTESVAAQSDPSENPPLSPSPSAEEATTEEPIGDDLAAATDASDASATAPGSDAETDADASNDAGPPQTADAAQGGDADTRSAGDGSTTADETPARDPAIPSDLLPPAAIVADSASEATDEDAGPAPMMELPPGLAQYGVFLEPDGPVDLRPTLDAPPTLADLDINAAAADDIDPLTDTKPIRNIDVKSDLAIEMAIDSDGYPLSDLMLVFSQVTGVPIQIDWVSFDLIGVDVSQSVNIPKTKLTPVRDLIDSVATPLGAEIQVEAAIVVLTPTDETFGAKVAQVTDLKDFGPGQASAVEVLNRFIGGPDVQPSPDLRIGPSRQDQQFAMLAVESLRRMRGLEPKLPDELVGHWMQVSDEHSIEWPLLVGGDAGPQRSTPLSVAGLVRRLAKGNGSTVVVHWMDGARRHLSPSQLILPHSSGDAASILDRLLTDYGLQARKVDGRRWWIGAPATYDRAKVVVWSKPLGDRADSLTEQISRVMADRDSFRVAMDPDSDRAILMLPRYIVRQLPKIEASIASN